MPESFTEDEFLVILDHYFSIKEAGELDADGLSEKLHTLDAVPSPTHPAHHRTGDGLRNVIGRFAAVDRDPPTVLASYAERLASQPLTEYRRIWDEYAGDPDAVRLRATQLFSSPMPGGAGEARRSSSGVSTTGSKRSTVSTAAKSTAGSQHRPPIPSF